MEKDVIILGSTGSIGRQSLDVIESLGGRVRALTANRNIDLLEQQIRKFKPELAAVADKKAAETLAVRVSDLPVRIVSGMEGLVEAASLPSGDTVITAVMGMVGLKPTLAAIRQGKRIALANKETLVCAGHLVMKAAEEHGAEIIPVDSEHSAIFQSLEGNSKKEIKQILLTASGGPFRGFTEEQLKNVTKADALKHPNWAMGQKITIDSATMMNKGLEFIEAMHLFKVTPEQIKVLIHPQSIIHSMVEYVDNSVIAQMGPPDMRIPIQYALTWPERMAGPANKIDFLKVGSLTFEEPDLNVFKCLALAMDAAKRSDSSCAVMNGANEAAVDLFLREKIGFTEIYDLVSETVAKFGGAMTNTVDEIIELDTEARSFVYGKA
ncbi:MAG: 1-deoxy-D-xylulose-5-phosphate reductoisomerase [Ruminococcaceae bacterium]|nr:1-deoxy-D-xylulose-5-phosphate reductoisomerase [Oscillospiraceae bacterium]